MSDKISQLKEVYNVRLVESGGLLNGTATRKQIEAEALSWRDVPWRHQGRTRKGVDCVGLIVEVAKSLQLMDYDCLGYARTTRQEEFVKHFKAFMKQKPVTSRKKGDILLLRDGTYAGHSAILGEMYGKEALIHSYAGRRKVVQEPLTPEILSRVTYCFEFPNIQEEN